MKKYHCHSETETIALGFELGRNLPVNTVICLYGDLGSGKTTLVKGIVAGACGLPAEQVNSPTFLYLNIYQGFPKSVYHFDLYRLRDSDEFMSMGFDEYFFAGGICCIEWPERIPSFVPEGCIKMTLGHQGETERLITLL